MIFAQPLWLFAPLGPAPPRRARGLGGRGATARGSRDSWPGPSGPASLERRSPRWRPRAARPPARGRGRPRPRPGPAAVGHRAREGRARRRRRRARPRHLGLDGHGGRAAQPLLPGPGRADFARGPPRRRSLRPARLRGRGLSAGAAHPRRRRRRALPRDRGARVSFPRPGRRWAWASPRASPCSWTRSGTTA